MMIDAQTINAVMSFIAENNNIQNEFPKKKVNVAINI